MDEQEVLRAIAANEALARELSKRVSIPFPRGTVELGCRMGGVYLSRQEHQPYDSARWVITSLPIEDIEMLRRQVVLAGAEPYSSYLRARPGRENTIDILAQYFESLLLRTHLVSYEQFERAESSRRAQHQPA